MSSLSRFRILGSLALVGMAAPLLAGPADQVRTRVGGLRALGASFKAVNDGLRAPTPQAAQIQTAARQISAAARAMYTWFPAGSGPRPGLETYAKPEVWIHAARFRQAQDAFSRQATAFQRAAATGNADAIRAASRSLGASCKGCHDEFRQPKD